MEDKVCEECGVRMLGYSYCNCNESEYLESEDSSDD
jgi:hypothetical protein